MTLQLLQRETHWKTGLIVKDLPLHWKYHFLKTEIPFLDNFVKEIREEVCL